MSANPVFNFQGLDHLAITVSDMRRSVDFYHGKLGMPVLHTLEYANEKGDIVGQHWFLGVGDRTNPHAHLALFWWRDGYQTLPPEQGRVSGKPAMKIAKPIGGLIHFNLRVDPADMDPYAQKLSGMGIPFRHVTRYATETSEVQASGLVNVGMRGITSMNEYHEPQNGWLMNSIYVFDPDGVELEFNAWAPSWSDWPANHVPRSNELAVT